MINRVNLYICNKNRIFSALEMNMKKNHYIHLLKNGSLMYTDFLLESDQKVQKTWSYNPNRRVSAYEVLVKAHAAGADSKQLQQVRESWGMDDADSKIFASCMNIELQETKKGWVANWKSNPNAPTLPKESVFEAVAALSKRFPVLFEDNLKSLKG
jgi:uncharacterized protein YpiB (UPF0302 family)